MSEEVIKKENKELLKKYISQPVMDFEAFHNLVGLFSLLMEEDKRKNPQKYAPKKQNNV